MLPRPHVAVARHLLAARHFRWRHLRIRQTSERGDREPQSQQTQDDDGATTRHD